MHEWALGEAIISTVSKIAKIRKLRKVEKVEIRVGELQQIEMDVFKYAISQLKGKKFEKTKFNIKTVKTKLKCKFCNYEWVFKRGKLKEKESEFIHFIPEIAHSYLKCPKCGSPDFEIVEGRGVWIESIKGKR